MRTHPFTQVDVFGAAPLRGNPLAVVHDADDLAEDLLPLLARWTNLSETAFLLAPTDPGADYRVRILTPGGELPFAGHPTLGAAHAWLAAGGRPRTPGRVVQQCGIGLVEVRDAGTPADVPGEGAAERAFRAPALLRSGPPEPAVRAQVVAALGVAPEQLRDVAWVDNGSGFLGVLLDDAATVLAARPDPSGLGDVHLGLVGPYAGGTAAGHPADVEVRALVPGLGIAEDPVTGSLHAGLATWLTRVAGPGRPAVLPPAYTARQGTVVQRDGRVRITTDPVGDVWVGGASTTVVRGTIDL